MSAEESARNDPCGDVDLEPRRPENRPALDEISYRIGRHSGFLARMLARITRETVVEPTTGDVIRPLRSLTSRATDDPSIALMDAWASALDVLTFYQERIANEGYLRTAFERVSAVELARTIGYELDPGVAASTQLAFTVEDADDPYREVEIPEGTQVMSVPEESGESPQIFETVESIAARAEWNAIPARTEHEQNLALYWNEGNDKDANNGNLYLLDIDDTFDLEDGEPHETIDSKSNNVANFRPVTAGLDLASTLAELERDAEVNPDIEAMIRAIPVDEIQVRGTGFALEPGDRVLCVGVLPAEDQTDHVSTVPFRIVSAEEDIDYALTTVRLAAIEAQPEPVKRRVLKFRAATLKVGAVQVSPVAFNAVNVASQIRRANWSGPTLTAFVRTQAWPRVNLMRLLRQPAEVVAPELGVAQPGLYVLRQSVGFFGNSAPKWEMLADPAETRGNDGFDQSWDADPRTVWTDSQGNALVGTHVFLERAVEEVVPDGWVLFETPDGKTASFRVATAAPQSRSDFAISGKTTGLTLRKPDGTAVEEDLVTAYNAFKFRTATARVASESLPLAGLPIREDVESGADEVTLDNLYLDLDPGVAVSVGGERSDAPGVEEFETQIVKDVTHTGGFTRLKLDAALEYGYLRTTVRVNANVALATHGERIDETLGDGDATRPNQAFALAKPPLTFKSAATETGSATTLGVRVNGIAWSEVTSLYDAGPEDEVYMTRIDDDETTRVVFGDGVHGKRLPSGALNVEASYRSGMGTDGEVAEETLIQLRTRPLGVRAVTNASPATGAAAAESRDEARERGPQSVRTLGRIVSLTDYEDFARAYAGIGKARADLIWSGGTNVVHVTVAPATDTVFEAASPTLVNLRDSVDRFRDPGPKLLISPHAARLFQLTANVFYDPRYVAADVEAAIRAHLEAVFGYDARALAQSVSTAQVIAAIHTIDGVDHLDVDSLQVYSEEEADAEPTLTSFLPARPARLAGTGDPPEILAAELLAVLPSAITLNLEPADG